MKKRLCIVMMLALAAWSNVPSTAERIKPDSLAVQTVKKKKTSKKTKRLDKKSKSKSKRTGRYYSVYATAYNPVKSQCDGDPLITADLSKIDLKKLKRGHIRWIAVSRDLLNQFRMGDIVEIDSDNPELCGEWEIHDLMNSRFKNKIDFLSPDDHLYGMDGKIIVNIRRIVYY